MSSSLEESEHNCNTIVYPVRTSPERVENGTKKSQKAFAFTRYRIEIVWKRHPERIENDF